MAKANIKAYKDGLGIYPRTAETIPNVEPIDWQALDNSNLNPINRVGDPALGSRNTGHPKELPKNQSRQDYDKQARGVK